MLDIKFIRENTELIQEAARKKHIDFDVRELVAVDEKRLFLLKTVEDMRAKQNAESEKIAASQNAADRQKLIDSMKHLKEELSEKGADLRATEDDWQKLMLLVPNVPDLSVPEGESDKDNVEVRKWGDIPVFSFEPKNHIELIQNLGLVDLERGIKISGFRGYFLKNDAVLLSFALWQFTLEKMIHKGFSPFIAPAFIKEDALIGTGHFPKSKEDVYKTQDDLYLSATAEIPMTNYYGGEILSEADLPIKYVAFSPCYRREAGSHGKDTKGIYRIHEFYKVEQFVLCKADHAESVNWHEELTKNAEEILQALKIPYRVVVNCGGDIGQAHVKTYDLESWVPSEKRYRETHSSSYYHDFQTRRANIRYRDSEGKIRFCYSLNNTALATPRILIPLLENYQQEDGSVVVPEVLRKWVGKEKIG